MSVAMHKIFNSHNIVLRYRPERIKLAKIPKWGGLEIKSLYKIMNFGIGFASPLFNHTKSDNFGFERNDYVAI